jgi:NAD(P)-dependent dehydrogenase (short-subunit alcohol dehydrogenase family)
MKHIVMTGGTSGLGAVAVKRLARSPGATVHLGARRPGPRSARTFGLDLARLEDVRGFAAVVGAQVAAGGIDGLVLNAGATFPHADGHTPDGFETTFAVNHLAHYLMLRLLLPRLNPGAAVVMTSSGTHDPAQCTVIPPPRHADARLLAHPDRDPDRDRAPRVAGGRAYSSSKLCVVLTARTLASRPEARDRGLTVVAYDPGPTPGTELLRGAGLLVRGTWRWLALPLRWILRGANTPRAAGVTLAGLALAETRPPPGRIYAALRRGRLTWPDPSVLARRDDLAQALWNESAALVGVEP